MKKLVGRVTQDERDEIRRIFERKNGLTELVRIINDDDALYERIVTDMGKTTSAFQEWWDTMSRKYNWESSPHGNWSIDFDTCNIFLED